MKKAFIHNNPTSDIDFVSRVFTGSQIEGCMSFLSEDDLFRRMKREEYISYIRNSLVSLAKDAGTKCMKQWNRKITHIIWGSMTGCIYAPSICVDLISELGLPLDTEPINIENMGCLTGYRCLALASDIVKNSKNSSILVIVGDIRNSLGNQFTEEYDRANVIVASLFRDSCCACIVSNISEGARYEILDKKSHVIPNTRDLVSYTEKNGGYIHLNISRDLPSKISESISSIISTLNISVDKCDVCVHTGGPRIINGIRDALHLDDDQLIASNYIMKKYGNLSGSSNLIVLNENIPTREYTLGISMGPGICVQCILLRNM